MTETGERWCGTSDRSSQHLAIKTSKLAFAVTVVDSPIASSPLQLDKFTYLNSPLRDPIRFLTVGGQTVEKPVIEPQLIGERVPLMTGPDDQSYLDVVAIGDAAGAHCTGIAITARWVLTAAHCIPATHVDLAVQTSEVLHTAKIVDAIVHPALDAAIVHLDSPLPITARPRRAATDVAPPEGIVRTIGFGVDNPILGTGFGIKRRSDSATSGWGCDAGRNTSAGCVVGAEMVLAGAGGRDTCWGDSGGPVVEPFGDTWRLIAITSRPTSRGGAPCGRGGVYVRVDALDPWIEQSMKEHR